MVSFLADGDAPILSDVDDDENDPTSSVIIETQPYSPTQTNVVSTVPHQVARPVSPVFKKVTFGVPQTVTPVPKSIAPSASSILATAAEAAQIKGMRKANGHPHYNVHFQL